MSGSPSPAVGGDLAAEAGSIVLLGDPLAALPETMRLARQTVRVIRQNILLFAFGFNAVAVALAGLRVMGPVAAAIVHQIGSLLVLLNADPIARFRTMAHVCNRASRRRLRVGLPPVPPVGCASIVLWRASGGRSFVRASCWAGWPISRRVSRVIEPGQAGLLRRFGRFQPPLLGPGSAPPLARAG